ncbi:MAG: aconitase/3-isopropylmalate dehydratase large subunit family protein [Candidatus Thermoplasmatota archaeon]|nr:aconitase/3-isopropylmalate dehydratase large subunit family protein [Candidatus Thermoplasmatota archaeon]
MGKTIIEKIIGKHCNHPVSPGDIVDMGIDARIARDFGGANVVKNLRENNLGIDDPAKTFFTFDCNPTGSDQKYAENQQICRMFARGHNIKVYDINQGIGTHVSIDKGLISPGGTLISTDSHANIVGAVGAFGQGMGDVDIAHAFAFGKVWFKVPPTAKIVLSEMPNKNATSKDIALKILRELGANGLLGYASEIYGDVVNNLGLSDRITISSMATEMGGIILLFPPNQEVINYCKHVKGKEVEPVYADSDAEYEKTVEIDINNIGPMISRPGHPEDAVPVSEVNETKIDSCFIGSCTNGRFEDMAAAAKILKNKKVAPGVVLKIVPSTYAVWKKCLDEGIIDIFTKAGALIGNPGCAGCAAGQIGQNGPGEVTVSTGNRNFPGKQGKGDVYLASPETVASSAVAGVITTKDNIPSKPVVFKTTPAKNITLKKIEERKETSMGVKGVAWVIKKDNVDTDMIFHNKYLSITDIKQMGKHTFENLEGWTDFPENVKEGDIVVAGKNFGCGSSRQQAVECFRSLGISVIIAESFGSIYERNAINSGMPVMTMENASSIIRNRDEIMVDFSIGKIKNLSKNEEYKTTPFSEIQMRIYQRGGILKR